MDSMRGQTVLVTGANSGIGFETARDLARLGAQVVLVCRSREKALQAIDDITNDASVYRERVSFELADLSLLCSIRSLVERLKEADLRFDVVINNAAILPPARKTLTSEGLEVTFVTNYLGPLYLTSQLIDGLMATKTSCCKIINVSSDRHHRGWVNLDDISLRTSRYPSVDQLYANTKFMLNMWTCWLARNVDEFAIKVYGVEPGFVNSKFTRSHHWLSFLWNLHVSMNSIELPLGNARIVNLAREQVNHAIGLYHRHLGVPHQMSERAFDYECQDRLIEASWRIINEVLETKHETVKNSEESSEAESVIG